MLTRLLISNYALIDHLEIDLYDGLTIITGETGAGKSIILGALGLLLGGRGGTQPVANDNRKTVVEAAFTIVGYGLKPLFDDADIDYDEQVCILRREVTPAGRSRAFVNDTPVTLNTLRLLATRLIDIHSQHSNMLLADPAFQLEVLDSLADNAPERQRYANAYAALVAAQRKLHELETAHQQALADEDYLRFQHTQLAELNLQPGEDHELETLLNRLSNVERLKEELHFANALLNAEENALPDGLRRVERHLRQCEEALPELDGMSDRLHSALIDIKDIAATVETVQEDLAFDPEQYERVNDRLAAIYSLERKHGVQRSDELLALQTDIEWQLADLEGGTEAIEAARADVERLTAEATAIATTLTAQRSSAAERFADELLAMAQPLGLKNLAFRADVSSQPLGPTGADRVTLLAAFNKNQPLTDVGQTASGGEVSRLMLCIKAITARTMHLPTLIFDEVDTGVSGDIATRMGELMATTAQHLQVLAITHLPQVAAQSVHHLLVYKTDTAGGTVTGVRPLTDNEHLHEIARMLSGHDVGREAIDNARALIDGRQTTK